MLELVIYLALFVGISLIIINSLVNVMRTYATAAAYRRSQTNGELIMERITRETRGASEVNVASSTFGVNPGVLAINSEEEDVAHAISFSVSSGKVQISDNGVTGYLSSDEVVVNSLVFRHIISGAQSAIKIELTLTTTNGYIKTSSFYDTIVLRVNE